MGHAGHLWEVIVIGAVALLGYLFFWLGRALRAGVRAYKGEKPPIGHP